MVDMAVRKKYVYGTGSTIPITFDEATPLDSSYLLVAVGCAYGTSLNPPSGWTYADFNWNASSEISIMYRQANGSVNGLAIPNGASVPYAGALFAFKLVTLAPAVKNHQYTLGSNNAGMPIANAGVHGVAIVAMHPNQVGSSYVWTEPFVISETIVPSVAAIGRFEYTPTGGQQDIHITFMAGTSQAASSIWAVWEVGTPAPTITKSYAKGSVPVTLAKGATKVEGQKG
jgi:hypothetical protein